MPPGNFNAITDVEGVRVRHVTLVRGSDVRTGAVAAHGIGDFVVAFSTTTRSTSEVWERVPEERLTEFFNATVEATEEAIIRSILKAETMVGRDGHVRERIPIEEVAKI